ncbi:molybdopterin-guanine dinucleotide biosynthesis protein B [Elioraea sp.]|uniref:molybdopterin-guanine dinucleotide biosynthesis protein B n=1 Tax=Elioraea sp. TaxID=2185103 RepID=UPI003F6F9327
MKVFGITGWSGSGKTTLLVRLIPALVARGLTVSTVKHAHHGFDVDRPGKDSYEHRRAGATEVLIGSANRWALMHELRGVPEPALPELLARMSPVDLVLVEGFKRNPHPKLEVWRAGTGKAPLFPEDAHILAVASDGGDVPGCALPQFGLDEIEAIAGFVIRTVGIAAPARAAG